MRKFLNQSIGFKCVIIINLSVVSSPGSEMKRKKSVSTGALLVFGYG